jgi:epoxyqueuosine reductase
MSLTDDIKNFALDLGYCAAGITDADGFPEYAVELASRRDAYAWYVDGGRQPLVGAIPRNLMPGARSIVSLAYDYAGRAFPEALTGRIGRLYQSRSYNAPEERIGGARTRLMREFLERAKCRIGQGIFIPERLAAARAGIATYGKNCFGFAEGIGSFVVFTSFVVDAELEPDGPTVEVKCPPKCRACIDACPTGAIIEPLKMDPQRCIAYNSFWRQDGVPGSAGSIPPGIREKMGNWVHGCDLCQEACPRNRQRLKAALPVDPFLEGIAREFDLVKLLELPEGFYRRCVEPLMYNYIKEKKYFRRNAAVAMGNSGDDAYVPALTRALGDPEPLVRGHAAWALGRIGGAAAKRSLEAAQAREADPEAGAEIEAALARAGEAK